MRLSGAVFCSLIQSWALLNAQPQIAELRYRVQFSMDWTKLPPGAVFGLMRSQNQGNKAFVWQGSLYRAPCCDRPTSGLGGSTAGNPVPGMGRQNGGDLGAPKYVGYYWFESVGEQFRFTEANVQLGCDLPPGLVIGLKHSANQAMKTVRWAAVLNPAAIISVQRFCLERQEGGDRGASSGAGFFWYETTGTRFTAWDAPMPPGMVFGLKHSLNQPGKSFVWRGQAYDPFRSNATPPRFERYCGGDLGAPSGNGFCWFETTGEGWPH